MEWYYVCWPWLTAKRVEPVVSISWASCELCDHFKNYYRIFTDGSKEGNRVAAAVVHWDNTKCVRLPDTASIFRAELYALLLAMDVVRRSKEKNFVIFSDRDRNVNDVRIIGCGFLMNIYYETFTNQMNLLTDISGVKILQDIT